MTYYNVGKLLVEAQRGEERAKYGDGFSFIDSEYKITIGDRYNYIDLLLYNIKYTCYVVIELKVTKLKKEHIGQIQTYMNYIDKNIKTINQEKTMALATKVYEQAAKERQEESNEEDEEQSSKKSKKKSSKKDEDDIQEAEIEEE